jgi:hypothetical protein
MTEPSGMYRTFRTGLSLNVVIFTMGPSVKKEGRGDARRHRPCREKSKESIGLRRPSAIAPLGRWLARDGAA